jgi:hypothetical protein
MPLRHWLFTSKGKTYLLEEYVRKERSIYDISDGVDVYPNLIRRAMVAHNIPRRDLSEAQKLALKTGRQDHPTEGRARTKQERDAIAGGQEQAWQNVTPESLELRREKARGQWAAMSAEERQRSVGRAHAATRKASVTGSRLARLVAGRLGEEGFEAHLGKAVTVAGEELKVDVYLPVERVAVEVLGPASLRPIWGDAEFERAQAARAVKVNKLRGTVAVVVVHYLKDRLSARQRRLVLNRVAETVHEFANTPPRPRQITIIDVDQLTGETSGT